MKPVQPASAAGGWSRSGKGCWVAEKGERPAACCKTVLGVGGAGSIFGEPWGGKGVLTPTNYGIIELYVYLSFMSYP